jgi:hypothetical protein
MTKEEIDAAWEATCSEIRAGVGMALHMGLARQKGKTANEVKRDFFVELAKAAYEAGCRRGFAEAKSRFEP